MPNIINIETRQHKKEHFVYIGDEKIPVHPLGPDMSAYENATDVTIFALRGWYYIPLEDKERIENGVTPEREMDGSSHDSQKLTPRNTPAGF